MRTYLATLAAIMRPHCQSGQQEQWQQLRKEERQQLRAVEKAATSAEKTLQQTCLRCRVKLGPLACLVPKCWAQRLVRQSARPLDSMLRLLLAPIQILTLHTQPLMLPLLLWLRGRRRYARRNVGRLQRLAGWVAAKVRGRK